MSFQREKIKRRVLHFFIESTENTQRERVRKGGDQTDRHSDRVLSWNHVVVEELLELIAEGIGRRKVVCSDPHWRRL